jgi:pimeloyl-ACP methyl ester carboxylesterase
MARLIKSITALTIIASLVLGACGEGADLTTEAIDSAVMEKVSVGDIDIAYKVFGEGDPLLLIMGYSGTMDLWSPEVLAELAAHYKVIIFDNRGMGNTIASGKKFTIELFADDTAGLLDALDIERSHVLAWSMGTNIAQELVLNYPDKVDKLILYAADCGRRDSGNPR